MTECVSEQLLCVDFRKANAGINWCEKAMKKAERMGYFLSFQSGRLGAMIKKKTKLFRRKVIRRPPV